MGLGATNKKLIVINTVRDLVNKQVAEYPEMTGAQASEIWFKALEYHFGQSLSTPDGVRRAVAEIMGK